MVFCWGSARVAFTADDDFLVGRILTESCVMIKTLRPDCFFGQLLISSYQVWV